MLKELAELKELVGLDTNEVCLQEFCENYEKIVIFGAYPLGELVQTYIEECICSEKVYAYSDNDPRKIGETLNDKRVLAPAELKKLVDCDESMGVIISSWVENSVNQIKDQLRYQIGISSNDIFYFDNMKNVCCGSRNDMCSWNFNLREMVENQKRIKKTFSILSDEKSISALKQMLKFRMTYQTHHLENTLRYNPMMNDYYFPVDIFKTVRNEVIIDGGAFNGDTIQCFADNKLSFNKIYSFEPDESTFEELKKRVKSLGIEDKVTLSKYGLLDKNSTVYFNDESWTKLGSAITENETSCKIECIALDDMDIKEKITYMKLNVEGAEFKALVGAKKILQEQKPKLFISNHHLTKHL